MSLQRRFKVTTTVTQYMWAHSRADAEKFQEELIRKGRLSLEKNGETAVKYCFGGGEEYIEAPEDISQTRDPVEEPRRLDWVEIHHGDKPAYALVRRLSRRKVYYFESVSRTERSIDRERWQRWAVQHTIHPGYDGVVPPFIVDEVIEEHQNRGLLSGVGATPDSSVILETLDKYGYVPDEYEIENGYWAETYIDRALSDHILNTESDHLRTGTDGAESGAVGDFSIAFSEDLPTFDAFDR